MENRASFQNDTCIQPVGVGVSCRALPLEMSRQTSDDASWCDESDGHGNTDCVESLRYFVCVPSINAQDPSFLTTHGQRRVVHVNEIIAEFLLRRASDASELARRAEILAALTQISARRRQQLARAVDTVCRTITQRGGTARVRFALSQHEGQRFLEVAVWEEQTNDPQSTADREDCEDTSPPTPESTFTTALQRLGELVDRFESSGWPFEGAVIRMAQVLPPAFTPPNESEVSDWCRMIEASSPLDALAFALQRARQLVTAAGNVRYREDLQRELARQSSDAENLQLLSLVTSTTKNAITIMDAAGTIGWVNDAFVQMTGYPPSEAIGKRPDELLFGPSSAAEVVDEFRTALRLGREWTGDIMQYRRDGQTYWVESNLIPVRDEAERLTRWITIDNDITKRHQTEEALRAAKVAAEAGSRAKSELLANLSHEIRTPMNAIIGMTDLALATELKPEQREYLQTARSSADSLLLLLNEILDFSKIEARKLVLEETNFHLADLVRDTLKGLAVRANEKGLELNARLPHDLPEYVRGDPTRLRQVLNNLVGNAIKFTEQGEVEVDVARQSGDTHHLVLHFSVRDTGIGIPREKCDKIFEPFTQADTSTTRKFGGSGLGLTITSELVRLMHGHVWVKSTVGEGTIFHFTIRLKPSDFHGAGANPSDLMKPHGNHLLTVDAHSPTAPSANTPGLSDQQEKWQQPTTRPLDILVADDHDANRRLAVTILNKRGHRCEETANGRDAIDLLRRRPFDVVLLDVQMPVMDGFETAAAIRQLENPTGRHTVIIALTAHAMTGDCERCLAAGMDGYLAKPLRPRDLVDLVESFADARPEMENNPINAQLEPQSHDDFDLGAALESLDNEVDLLLEQMQFLVNDGPDLIRQIGQAIAKNEPRTLEIAAHRLKGLLARYAYPSAVELALDLENIGKQGTVESARAAYERLIPLVDRLVEAIRAFMSQHGRHHGQPD